MQITYYTIYQTTNLLNNYIYIGAHKTFNPNDSYFGSGTKINEAIKEFGRSSFKKEILFTFKTEEEMMQKEAELVNGKFICRLDTYNVVPGGGKLSTNGKVNVKNKDGETFCVPINHPKYLSSEYTGVTKGKVTVKDIHNNTLSVEVSDPRYLSGELVHIATNNVVVVDKSGKKLTVSNTDPRYLSGELISIWKNRIVAKDDTGKLCTIYCDDPRYLSGELVPQWKGKTHSIETRKKMSDSKKGKYIGVKNSQYGTCWICKRAEQKNKKIQKTELKYWLDQGWIKGRIKQKKQQ